jgi:hypothetical protein
MYIMAKIDKIIGQIEEIKSLMVNLMSKCIN